KSAAEVKRASLVIEHLLTGFVTHTSVPGRGALCGMETALASQRFREQHVALASRAATRLGLSRSFPDRLLRAGRFRFGVNAPEQWRPSLFADPDRPDHRRLLHEGWGTRAARTVSCW